MKALKCENLERIEAARGIPREKYPTCAQYKFGVLNLPIVNNLYLIFMWDNATC